MIPLKLELSNFLSYGDAEIIDFEPYHLICLCGKNGHGKSALLDAITWVVWGQARKIHGTIKADYNLLRLGETQMFVSFELLFNNQKYRIRREYAQTYGKPHAALDFGIVDADNGIRSLTDKTIRATQQKINETIGLDYDTFVNTAFLRQGNSNEFSKKTPKERKEILAEILGLQTYEQLKKCALERVRTMNQDALYLEQTLATHQQELEQKKSILEAQQENTKLLDEISKQEKKNSQRQEDLQKQKNSFAKEKNEYERLINNNQELLEKQKKHKAALQELVLQWSTTIKELHAVPDAQALEVQRQQLQKKLGTMQKQRQQQLELKDALLTLKEQEQQTITQIKKQFQQDVQNKQIALSNLEQKKTTLLEECKAITKQQKEAAHEQSSLEKELEHLTKQQQTLSVNQKETASKEEVFEKKKRYYHTWIARANTLTARCKELKVKLTINDHDTTNCPLCEQNLSASRRKFLHDKFEKEYALYQHQLNRLKQLIAQLKSDLVKEHETLQDIRKKVEESKLVQVKSEQHHKLLTAIQEQNNALQDTQKKRLDALATTEQNLKSTQQELNAHLKKEEEQLNTHQELVDLKTKRNALETELKQHAGKQKHYAKIVAELEALEKQQQELQCIQEKKAKHNECMQAIRQQCIDLKTMQQELNKLPDLKLLQKELEQSKKALAQQEAELQKTIQTLQQQKEVQLQQKGTIDQKLTTVEKLEIAMKKQKKQQKELATTIDEFQTIATAFGKNGIQALLIEDAIPELEHEANELLSKLTNNQSHIIIESLKDLKKGGTKETLDITISDALGTRPYEMFSGGEAFRIDFALRIAISKLLARRAGTSLQTLIIDEGFGSQDEEGLHHIMDAIHTIQDDFCKVIIVSHLPALKEQFPVHFMVQKDMNGSHVTVHELG